MLSNAEFQALNNMIGHLQLQLAEAATRPQIIPLSPNSVLAKTHYGSYLAVPTWNIDVVPGIVRDGVIEPATTAVARILARPGMNIVNAGANFGYYTVYYAHLLQRKGAVYSIEANKYVIPYLMRSIFWAGYPDTIRLFHAAVAEEDDVVLKLTFDPQFLGGGSAVQQGAFSHSVETMPEALWENVDLKSDFLASREWRVGSPITFPSMWRLASSTPSARMRRRSTFFTWTLRASSRTRSQAQEKY